MDFLQQGFTGTLTNQPVIYGEMGTEPGRAQPRCGTGFCILNKPVKGKQRLLFVLEDVPEQQGLFAWLGKLGLRRELGSGEKNKNKINVLGQEGPAANPICPAGQGVVPRATLLLQGGGKLCLSPKRHEGMMETLRDTQSVGWDSNPGVDGRGELRFGQSW